MRLIQRSEPHHSVPRAVEELRVLGFDPIRLASASHDMRCLEALPNVDRVQEILAKLSSQYYKKISRTSKPYMKKSEYLEWLEEQPLESLARSIATLGVLNQVKVYLYWCRDWIKEGAT
jgi:hypothetical protein